MFSEQLLEFEESLSTGSSACSNMLSNLDLKADSNRFAKSATDAPVDEAKLTELFASYNHHTDEAAICGTCRNHLARSTSSCCSSFLESQAQRIHSSAERDYWLSFFDDPYKTILALPNYSRMTFFQAGVPSQIRGLVWQKLLLVNQTNKTQVPEGAKMVFRNFQHSYDRGISKQIGKDLNRTFPAVAFFQKQDTVDALLTIMSVYANYDVELGYCQGLLFLVGTLYYHFQDRELTFHTLCKIMECEPELRSIFVPGSMSSALERWYEQFLAVLASVDGELASHLTSFCDCRVFLYQWWLSMALIHAPDFSVNNRIVDFCLVEGWKVGMFKLSVGVLLRNRPILMSFASGDEDVVYQHLLNESKWGNIVGNLTDFFGNLLLSWDDAVFSTCDVAPSYVKQSKKTSHKRSASTVLQKLRCFNLSESLPHFGAEGQGISNANTHLSPSSVSSTESLRLEDRSLLSVFSGGKDNESICSDATSMSWDKGTRARGNSDGSLGSFKDLAADNEMLKALLRRAHAALNDEALKAEISAVI